MADPVPTAPITTTPTAPAPGPEPVAAAPPASAPAIEPAKAPEPTVSSSPPLPSAPAPEAKPSEPAPSSVAPAASVPTLLEKFDKEKADAAKTPVAAGATGAIAATGATAAAVPGATGTQEATAAAASAAPVVPAAAPSVEYKYTLPETIKMDDAMKGEVHKAFDDFRANPSEGAQGLINLHEKTMREFAQFMADEQQRQFTNTRQTWAKQITQDQELGGSGYQTTMGAVARMRDLFVAEKDRPAFEQMLRTTGVGDHPEFIRMLHQAARFYDEPALPPPNPRPPQGNGQRPSRRLRDVYDHPRSTPEGRS